MIQIRFQQIGEPFEVLFVEVETLDGKSINVGKWSQDSEGYWLLTISADEIKAREDK